MAQYQGKTIFFGDLHTHTGFSDGKKTPEAAFRQAAANGLLDFMAVSDHAASMTPEKFAATRQAAKDCSTEKFLALAACENGFSSQYENEYGVPVVNGGELVTLAADRPCSESDSLETFVQILSRAPNAFGGFAHPQEASWPTEYLWNGYDMARHRSPEVLRFVRMIEVCNETSAYNLLHEKLYPTALDCGFHVSPTAVSDTHQANWGGPELQARTAVFASSLTETDVLEALRRQRCYATETGNTLLDFSINGKSMGETLPPAEEYALCVDLDEPDEVPQKQIVQIQLISDYGQILRAWDCSGFSVHIEETLRHASARYFFLRAVNREGKRIWSAPIWTGRPFDRTEDPVPLRKLSKEAFQVVCSTAPDTAPCLYNSDPSRPWRCTSSSGEIVLDLGAVYPVRGVGYHRHTLPYENRKEIASLLNRYAYALSLDGRTFTTAAEGIIGNYGSEQIHRFPEQQARFLKVEARSSVGGDAGIPDCYPAIGEISVYI